MLLSPVYNQKDKKAWENFIIYEDGYIYAFFGTGKKCETNRAMAAIGLDVYRSLDGVNFELVSEYTNPIVGAHAGFCVKKIGDYFYYYPTCSNAEKGVHFKIYRTKDFKNWEHLGDEYDVVPDRSIYHERWDEMVIIDDVDAEGKPVYYGYISSEPREEIAQPGAGMLSSYDGIHWTILPPVKVDWGEIPAQHMELNFVEKIDGKYYMSMSGRLYMDSYGYSLYTFVGETPFGPFHPDIEKFRLSGNSRKDITWLGHTVNTPFGLLAALWLSHDFAPDIPSKTFAISTLKWVICEKGHLRLAYWQNNDVLFENKCNLKLSAVYPDDSKKSPRDKIVYGTDGSISISASRDGVVMLSDKIFDKNEGILLEGTLTCTDNRGHIATHQHAAGIGFYFESTPGSGTMMYADTLGITRSGNFQYSHDVITDFDIYRNAGYSLAAGRSGILSGTSVFNYDDTVGPFGHASYSGIRHGKKHNFKVISRMDYFELYIDDYYVQTYLLPDQITGRVGFCVFDGSCEVNITYGKFKKQSII